jgi:hypothetical protein
MRSRGGGLDPRETIRGADEPTGLSYATRLRERERWWQ